MHIDVNPLLGHGAVVVRAYRFGSTKPLSIPHDLLITGSRSFFSLANSMHLSAEGGFGKRYPLNHQ